MRLIDADELKDKLCEHCVAPYARNCTMDECREMLCSAMDAIDDALTIDAVPVVRCKDCIHYSHDEIGWCDFHSHFADNCSWFDPDEDDFCSIGERRPT